MSPTLRTALLFLIFALALDGCVENTREEATGKANIRGINTLVESPDVSFLIEERSLGSLSFASASSAQRFDDLHYTFNFDLPVPGRQSPRRLVSQDVDVQRDHDYVFVLSGSVDTPRIVLWDDEERTWDGSETVFEMAFAHFNNDIGAVDIHFAAPGTAPAAGNELGTIGHGDRIPAQEFEAGEYALIVTAAGDPQNVLFSSAGREFAAATTGVIVLFDDDPSRTGNVTVRHISKSGATTVLSDSRFPPAVRVLHAANGVGNIDVYEGSEFTQPLIADLAFGERSGDAELTAGADITYTYTAAGNVGAPLFEDVQTVLAGLRYKWAFVGPANDPDIVAGNDVRRAFATSARIEFTHAAANFDLVDLYLQEAGQSIEDANPTFANVPFKVSTGMRSVQAGNYELTVTPDGEKTPLAGPLPIDLVNGDVVDVFILDTTDPGAADLQIHRNSP